MHVEHHGEPLCHQVAALVPDMLCYFYQVKDPKVTINPTNTYTRGKIGKRSLEF
jgi:hypothetical protein